MSMIMPVFAALAHHFVSGKPLQEIARDFKVNSDDLARVFAAARGNLWNGRLARALQFPENRPDLHTHLTLLASLEHHYSLLMAQWKRAEETCAEVRKLKEPDL